MGWVRQGGIWYDDGEHSDKQIGKASSTRLVNSDLPGCRLTIYAYAAAEEYQYPQEAPVCTHTEPEGWVCKNDWPSLHNGKGPTACHCWVQDMPEHVACSHDLSTLHIETLMDYQRDNRNPATSEFFDPNYEELRYGRLSSQYLGRDIKAAEMYAAHWIRNLPPFTITWDGKNL